MPYNSSLDDLGDAIEAMVDRAVNSRNFQNLNRNIRRTVNEAMNTAADSLRKAAQGGTEQRKIVEERRDFTPPYAGSRPRACEEQPNVNIYSSKLGSTRATRVQSTQQNSNLPMLYGTTTGKFAGGVIKAAGGGFLTISGLGGLLGNGILAHLFGMHTILGGFSLILLAGGMLLLSSGIRSVRQVWHFRRYLQVLDGKTQCELERLARAVGKKPKFVRKELKGMIDSGMFLEGHLDEEENNLITSNESYTYYLEAKQKQAIARQQAAADEQKQQAAQEQKKRSAQLQEVLDKGNAFISEIRACNDAIPGEEISDKISRMEMLVRTIFDRAEDHPEIVPELKKLMNYYLPMTVKLLKAYAEMDAQPIQGENIRASKQEIEQTLDTLNAAFEKLLNSIFKSTALDVSSDITVLNTLLAQEGLTDDGLSGMHAKQETDDAKQ